MKTNYSYIQNFGLFRAAESFVKLSALNLSMMVNHAAFSEDIDECWPELESFTMDLYDLKGANSVVRSFVERKAASCLKRLRLMSFSLRLATLSQIVLNAPSLTVAQLVDVQIKVKLFWIWHFLNWLFCCFQQNVVRTFTIFAQLEHLQTLRIEYTFQDDFPHHLSQESLKQFEEFYNFNNPTESAKSIYQLLSNTQLENLSLLYWPGLKRSHFNEIDGFREKIGDINFVFKEYEFKWFILFYLHWRKKFWENKNLEDKTQHKITNVQW